MAKTKKSKKVAAEAPTFVWKVVPVGDSSFYGWKKFDVDGNVVEQSQQQWPDALTVEKMIRSLAARTDRIEVSGVHNINTEDNHNVDLVKPHADTRVENAGMTKVKKGVEERRAEADGTLNEQDPNQNPDGNSVAAAKDAALKEPKKNSQTAKNAKAKADADKENS